MNKQHGFTLTELIVFIVVVGIVATGSLIGLQQALIGSYQPGNIAKAAQLANARMNVILQKRHTDGFDSLLDPCAGGSSASLCVALANFASTHGLVVNTSITTASSTIKIATVVVSGSGSFTVTEGFIR